MRQDLAAGFFGQGEFSKNVGQPDARLYSNLNSLEGYRSDDGYLYFKLVWPNLCKHSAGCPGGQISNIWRQTSNPVLKTSGGVVGFEAIDSPFRGQGFYGLEHNPGATSLLDGSSKATGVTDPTWFYAIGSTTLWNNGIPGPSTGSVNYPVDLVELYVKRMPAGEHLRLRRSYDVAATEPDIRAMEELEQNAITPDQPTIESLSAELESLRAEMKKMQELLASKLPKE